MSLQSKKCKAREHFINGTTQDKDNKIMHLKQDGIANKIIIKEKKMQHNIIKTKEDVEVEILPYINKLATNEVYEIVNEMQNSGINREDIFTLFENIEYLDFSGKKNKAMNSIIGLYGIAGVEIPSEVRIIATSSIARSNFIYAVLYAFDIGIVSNWCSEVGYV
jgi:hypothetical protein